MSSFNFNDVMGVIGNPEHADEKKDQLQSNEFILSKDEINVNEKHKPFDVSVFVEELRQRSEDKNRLYYEYSSNINGYSIAHDCIGTTVKKILGYPVHSFAHKWLPIILRAAIGTAIHEFIQHNTHQFTEIEKSIKIPSIRFSGRLDGLIGNNVLVEIKSCTYKDYAKIIKNQQPRKEDFYQAMTYKYILENYLEEAKQQVGNIRTDPPILDEYKIDTIQFIYVAHDILGADIECLSEAIKIADGVKKALNSKRNHFHNIGSVTLDVNIFDPQPYIDFIKGKIDAINWYLNNNKIPGPNDPFVDKKKCYFCLYKDNCELI